MNMIERSWPKPGQEGSRAGDIVVANVDRMSCTISAPIWSRKFRKRDGGGTIFDPDRIAFVFDHTFSPPARPMPTCLPKPAASPQIRHPQPVRFGFGQHPPRDHRKGLWARET